MFFLLHDATKVNKFLLYKKKNNGTVFFFENFNYLWVLYCFYARVMAQKEAINRLAEQVKLLIEEHRRKSEQCDRLAAECQSLKEENRSLQERVKQLDSELATVQLGEGLAGDNRNKAKARARVNRLMREVDRCIAIVKQQE